MEPLKLEPLIDLLKQLGLFFGNLFISIWNSIPGLPNELKEILVGLAFLTLLVRMFKSGKIFDLIQDYFDEITYILAK